MNKIKYMTSLLAFYLKGEISQEQNFVNFKIPNTILGFIPIGTKKESIPVSQLSSIESNFKLYFKRFLIGLIISISGLLLMSISFLAGLVILAIGANYVITAFDIRLTVKTTAGEIKNISFLIFEKSKLYKAETQIRQVLSDRLDDTNNRMQTDRIVDAINNK